MTVCIKWILQYDVGAAYAERGFYELILRNMCLPQDIEYKIKADFSEKEQEAKNILKSLTERTINVGIDQLMRSVISLADGNIEELRKLALFKEDPRYIVRKAGRAGLPSYKFR